MPYIYTFYKICCKDVAVKDIYVGSTKNDLRKRKNAA